MTNGEQNRKTTHIKHEPGQEPVEATIYEYPTRVVIVVFAKHAQTTSTRAAEQWAESLLGNIKVGNRELLLVGSDGGYRQRPDAGPAWLKVIYKMLQRQFKLSDKQAANYGLFVDRKFAIVPQRDRSEPSGWLRVRYRYEVNVTLKPPADKRRRRR